MTQLPFLQLGGDRILRLMRSLVFLGTLAGINVGKTHLQIHLIGSC